MIPIINAVNLSSKIFQAMKNATSEGIVIINPINEPLRKISFVGRAGLPFLSNESMNLSDNKNQRCFIFWSLGT